MNLKQSLILSIFLIINSIAFSQNKISEPFDIKDYFLLIPKSILKISQEKRIEILKNKTIQEVFEAGDYYQLDTLDFKNGYLEFHTIGDGSGDIYEMTYFKLKDKKRIIALNIISWAMCCEDSQIHFYKIKDNKWIEITKSVIPEISLKNFYFDDKITENAKSELFLRYFLPQNGKNIKVKLADTFFEYMDESDFEKLFKAKRTDTIKLIWNDGIFSIP